MGEDDSRIRRRDAGFRYDTSLTAEDAAKVL
jgi:hypothetical protein